MGQYAMERHVGCLIMWPLQGVCTVYEHLAVWNASIGSPICQKRHALCTTCSMTNKCLWRCASAFYVFNDLYPKTDRLYRAQSCIQDYISHEHVTLRYKVGDSSLRGAYQLRGHVTVGLAFPINLTAMHQP